MKQLYKNHNETRYLSGSSCFTFFSVDIISCSAHRHYHAPHRHQSTNETSDGSMMCVADAAHTRNPSLQQSTSAFHWHCRHASPSGARGRWTARHCRRECPVRAMTWTNVSTCIPRHFFKCKVTSVSALRMQGYCDRVTSEGSGTVVRSISP